jgi:poly(A) polymerase
VNRQSLIAQWQASPALSALVAALSVDSVCPRLVGGAVRDGLLGLAVADIDLATPLTPDVVSARLIAAGIKAVPTGIAHGTITAVADGQSFEVTTLRRDVSTDGRRATVAFSTDWHEDAARRDFTINALYADPVSGEFFDYFGGIADLEAGIVRFIGDARERIAEDHLRILRFFRFYARFGKGAPDAEALAACTHAASSLMALSRERISDELSKLLALPDPLASVELMIAHGIFAAFIPEVREDAAHALAWLLHREKAASVKPKSGRRLNALLPKDPVVVDKVAARFKLSNRLRQSLTQQANGWSENETSIAQSAYELAYRHGTEMALDIILLHGSDRHWQDAFGAVSTWTVPTFPINGGQLIERGLTAGPDVAACLKMVERSWIAEGFPGIARAQKIADQCVVDMLSIRKA